MKKHPAARNSASKTDRYRPTKKYAVKDKTERELTEDLGGVTTTTHADADVNVLELVVANEEHRLENLVPHGLREEAIDGGSIDVKDTLSPLAVRDRDGVLLQSTNTTQRTHHENL